MSTSDVLPRLIEKLARLAQLNPTLLPHFETLVDGLLPEPATPRGDGAERPVMPTPRPPRRKTPPWPRRKR